MADNFNSEKNRENNQPSRASGVPWVKIVLAVSLSLNLLIAGVIFGNSLHEQTEPVQPGRRVPAEARMMREMGLGPFLGAFPPEQRRQLGRNLRERLGTLQMNRAALADELGEILSAVRAAPYVPETLESVFERQKNRVADRAAEGRNLLLDTIRTMSAEERQAFATRMERSMARALENAGRLRP